MVELVGNLHAHTIYSDGAGTHAEVAKAAIQADLDFIVTTDHNVLVQGVEGYYSLADRSVLLLTAEEIHDQSRQPQKNHLLVYGVESELAQLGADPQELIDEVTHKGGYTFLAHPVDRPAPLVNEPDLSWVDWQVKNFTGIELWNFGSEFKGLLTSWPRIIYYSLFPAQIVTNVFSESLNLWDDLLKAGEPVFIIGGADAHGNNYRLGTIQRTIFPYAFLFKTINTHVLLDNELSNNVEIDQNAIFTAIGTGRGFVANDGLAPARGFRFAAEADYGEHQMGESVQSEFGMTIKIRLPRTANVRVVHDGKIVKEWLEVEAAILPVRNPGAYRVEAFVGEGNKTRGWIYSNPIFLVD